MSILIFVGVLFIFWLLDPTVIYMCNEFGRMAGSDAESAFMISTLLQSCWSIGGFIFAFFACFKWRKHKAAKKAAEVVASEVPSPQPDPEPTIADPTSPAPATPKLRYCKLCSAPIDPVTRKCTRCGKQHFRLPHLNKKHLFISIGALSCIVAAVFIVTLATRLGAAEAKVEELNVQIAALNTELAEQKDRADKYTKIASNYSSNLGSLQSEYDELRKLNATYREYLDYCEFYCAYVTCSGDNIIGNTYHRLDCRYTESAEYLLIFYIDFLEGRGFVPCSHCYD